ncbi:MAG TPA: 5-oxoprolinase subunit PxpB [Terriglobales bacterium]|nr:5-oxoprolinase subunit PxpB [Terriglobales bacterium]
MRVEIASDASLLVRFGESASDECFAAVTKLFQHLQALHDPRIRNLHPAYATVLIDFDPLRMSHEELSGIVNELMQLGTGSGGSGRIVRIPVCYGSEFGPDLAFVSEHSRLSVEEVIRLHSSASYVVHFLGFSPGFGYLDGLPARLACPRLESPRTRVAAGSVGIAGAQTGVYPLDSPGGWRLVGRTPLRMFDPLADSPSRLEPGDTVQFVAIDRGEFDELASRERAR